MEKWNLTEETRGWRLVIYYHIRAVKFNLQLQLINEANQCSESADVCVRLNALDLIGLILNELVKSIFKLSSGIDLTELLQI